MVVIRFVLGLVLVIINAVVHIIAHHVMIGMDLGEAQEDFWTVVFIFTMLFSAWWLVSKFVPSATSRMLR